MITKKLFIVASVALVSIFTLSSCQSKEERVINRLETLCEDIENVEMFDEEVMERYKAEMLDIKEYSAGCEFSAKQQACIIRLSGRFVSAVATKMPLKMRTNLGKVSSNIRELVSIMDGMIGKFNHPQHRDIKDMEFDMSNVNTKEANDELDDALNSWEE